MITFGEFFKEVRVSRGWDYAEVERRTKIRKEFIRSIEKQEWHKLPEYTVLFGFIKNLAKYYEVDEGKAIALFRRDYPPQKDLDLNPKPAERKKLSWSPKLTFVFGIVAVLLVVSTYLGIQYINFVKPPKLEVIEPTESQVVTTRQVKVLGTTDPEATVKVNNQPLLISDQGVFEDMVNVAAETQEIEVKSTSRSGKESIIRRRIEVTLP
jgi:cytoskeleton protein RodZ